MAFASADTDRKLLHLKALYDTSRELGALSDPTRILYTFLLMTMGPLGAGCGFVLFMKQGGSEPIASSRGLDEYDESEIVRHSSVINDALFGPECRLPGRVEIITAGDAPALPPQIETLVRWCGPGDHEGLLGLGKIYDTSGSQLEQEEFIVRLIGILISSLRGAAASQEVAKLNEELAKQNAELEEAMSIAANARRELDRKVFELDMLYEATNELSGLVDTKPILETFLLTAMGAFSTSSGGIYLHDTMFPKLVLRGTATDGASPDRGAVMGVLSRFFQSANAPNPIPMSVVPLTGEKVLKGAAFPFEAGIAVAFAVNKDLRGVMVLGPRLNEAPYRMSEQRLLKTLTGNFLIFLKNARYFEEIAGLNDDLVRRNQELNQALSEVSQCRVELSDVELAKEKILTVIQRETTRTNRVRKTDFIFILLLAVCVGWLFNFTNPNGVEIIPAALTRQSPEYIDAQWTRIKQQRGTAVILDARPAAQFNEAHIRGAVNVPSSLFDFVYSMRLASLPTDTEIIVYGRTVSRHYDEDVAFRLTQRDFTNVKVLSDGLETWANKGYPVNR